MQSHALREQPHPAGGTTPWSNDFFLEPQPSQTWALNDAELWLEWLELELQPALKQNIPWLNSLIPNQALARGKNLPIMEQGWFSPSWYFCTKGLRWHVGMTLGLGHAGKPWKTWYLLIGWPFTAANMTSSPPLHLYTQPPAASLLLRFRFCLVYGLITPHPYQTWVCSLVPHLLRDLPFSTS